MLSSWATRQVDTLNKVQPAVALDHRTGRIAILDQELHRVRNFFRTTNSPHRENPGLLGEHLRLLRGGELTHGPKPSMTEYLRHPHVLTSFNADLRGHIDEQLAGMGLHRQVV